jgi:hypothetical protein
MSSGDFTYITLRNITAYQPNNNFVPSGYILTTSTNGKANWKNVDDIIFTSISSSIATSGMTINAITSSILSSATVSTLTSKILTNENISTIAAIILANTSLHTNHLILNSATFQ